MKQAIWLVLGLLATSFSVMAQTYRWVDSNGQVHYSSSPPMATGDAAPKVKPTHEETTATLAARVRAEEKAKQATQNEQVKTDETGAETASAADEKQAAYNQQMQQRAASDAAQLKVACDGMRKDLAVYTNYPRAKVDVDGVIRRLTPDELSARITDLQRKIQENCLD